MQQIEKPLDNAFKKVPQLPENIRKGLTTAVPWLALVGGILSLIFAWNLYRLATIADQYLTGVYSAFGYTTPLESVAVAWTTWAGIIIIVVQAVMLLVAFPALRTFKKSGWTLLLWADILLVGFSVVTNVLSGYIDIGGLLYYLVGAVVGLYFLFQIRPYYTAGGAAKPASTPTKTAPTEKTDNTEPKV